METRNHEPDFLSGLLSAAMDPLRLTIHLVHEHGLHTNIIGILLCNGSDSINPGVSRLLDEGEGDPINHSRTSSDLDDRVKETGTIRVSWP